MNYVLVMNVASYKGKLEYPILTDDNIYSVANADIFHMSYKEHHYWCMQVVHEGI